MEVSQNFHLPPSPCSSLLRFHPALVSHFGHGSQDVSLFPHTVILSTIQGLTKGSTEPGSTPAAPDWLRDALEPQTFTDIHNMHTNRAALASTSVGEPQTGHTGAGTRTGAAPMEQEAPQEAAEDPSRGDHAGNQALIQLLDVVCAAATRPATYKVVTPPSAGWEGREAEGS